MKLKELKEKVGLFTSPHIFDFRERIRVNGKKITEDEFLSKYLTEGNFSNYYTTLFLTVEIKILSRVFDDTLTPPPLV